MNQTLKLIFRKTNFVAAKHMKTFSFPEMLLHKPNTPLEKKCKSTLMIYDIQDIY